MRTIGRNDDCPCGSGQKLKKCCGLALQGGKPAPTAEALMRSRYTAYVMGEVDYLYRTTHPTNKAVAGIPLEQFRPDLVWYCGHVDFRKLTIHRVWPEDEEGVARVSFTADMVSDGQPDELTELSDFVREGGRWLYLSGRELKPDER